MTSILTQVYYVFFRYRLYARHVLDCYLQMEYMLLILSVSFLVRLYSFFSSTFDLMNILFYSYNYSYIL